MKRETIWLDGQWTVAFDPENVGKQRKWYRKFPKGEPIAVPGVWEEVRPGYDGVGWYRTTFTGTDKLLGRHVRIRFGAVNYFSEVWLNGEKIGQNEGGYTPFEFDLTGLVREGDNELVVRVIDPPRRKAIEGFRSGAPLSHSDTPAWKAGWYWNFGGIWQSVKLMLTDPVYIDDVFVEPIPGDRTAKVHVTVRAERAAEVSLDVDVAPWKGRVDTGGSAAETVKVRKGTHAVTLPVKIRKMQLWDTENPFLYVAKVRLATDKADTDALDERFGMRTFTVKDGHFQLNGKRVVLKGVLQQGAYPVKLAYPPSEELLRKELELVKKGNMNFVRLHLKPDCHSLDLMDEMGILAVGEPPCGWIANSPQVTERCLHEVEGLVKRDRNHPCIIMWCMLNEIYHYWTFTNKELDRLRYKMSSLGRDLDPTRIIGDNSGGAHAYGECAGAMMPYSKKYSPLRDYHQYCATPLTPEILEERYRKLPKRGGPLYISEFGAFENPPDWEKTLANYTAAQKKKGLEDYAQYRSYADSMAERFEAADLGELFDGLSGLIAANNAKSGEEVRAMVSAQRANPNTDGYAICQIADASGEIFGVSDIWREPKPYYHDFAAAAQVPWISVHLHKRTVEPGQKVPMIFECINEHLTGEKLRLEVTLKRDGGRKVLEKWAKDFTSRGWVQRVLKESFQAPDTGGRYVVEAVLKRGRTTLCKNDMRLTVVEMPALADPTVVALGDDAALLKALRSVGVQHLPFTNSTANKSTPFIFRGRSIQEGGPSYEHVMQTSRQVRLGGVAIVLEPWTQIFYDVLLPKPIRMMSPMRSIGYAHDHPILDGLPTGVVDYEFARLLRGVRNVGDDVRAAGGRTIVGAIGAHMWTKPDEYQWTTFVDEISVGRGRVILANLMLLEHYRDDPVARRLLRNLVAYAHSAIVPGNEEAGIGRPMDPITKP